MTEAEPPLRGRSKIDSGSLLSPLDSESIFNSVREPMLVLDAALWIRHANRSFYRTFKIGPEETLNRPLKELSNRSWDIPALQQLLHEVLLQNRPFDDFEVAQTFETLGRRVLKLNARPLLADGVRSEYILLAIDDRTLPQLDTTSEQATAQTAETSGVFRTESLNQVGQAVVVTNPQGKILSWNAFAEALYGWSHADALGRNLAEVIVPKEGTQPAEKIAHLMQSGKSWSGEFAVRRRDGSIFTAQVTTTPIFDDQKSLTAFVGVSSDISARRQLEDALRESEQRFRGLMEQAPFSVQVFSPAGHTLRVNRAWEQLWGITQQQLGNYNILKDPQLEQKGVLPFIRRGFSGEITRIPAIEYDPRLTIPELASRSQDPRLWVAALIYPLKDTNGRIREIVLVHDDITARTRVEQELAQRTERSEQQRRIYETALSNTADFNYVFDLQGRFIYVNKALLDLWQKSLSDAVGKDFFELGYPPELAQRLHDQIQQVIRTKQPLRDETPYTSPAGSRHYEYIFLPVLGEHGEVEAVAGSTRDVTQRKEMEEALLRARRRLEEALRAGSIATWTWDIANNQLRADEKTAEWFSIPPEDAMDGPLSLYIKAIHPDDQQRVLDAIHQAVSNGAEYEADYRVVQNQGYIRWVAARGRVERDSTQQPIRMAGVLVDISGRKEAEEALRESERRYRAIGESIDYGVWICDPSGRNTYASESFLRLVGLTQDECSSFGWSRVLHPAEAEQTIADWNKCVQTGGRWDREHRFKGVDGHWHSVLARGVPVRDEQGKITGWVGINLDIGRLKEIEEALRNADRRKDEFLATLAHELRNPLAPIRNSLQILKMPRIDASIAQQTREIMERQVHHLVRLVDDLLDVSRVMGGKIELRKEPVELATIIARAVETAAPLIEIHCHHLEIALSPDSLLLDADPVRLAQVVGNLLTNAAKYTEPNGHLCLSADRDGDQAVLRVRDNGIGVAPEMLPHIFELFVQVDHAATRSQGGLGIGLTLVKNLVEMHQGTVVAHSLGLGKGCEFVVRLPLVHEEIKQPLDLGGADQAPVSSGHRLLVVDDNHDAALSLALLLQLQGHEVRIAHDGVSALHQAQSFLPDMVFLDIGMPEMDGFEVARRMRQLSGVKHTVLVALTGWGQPEDRRRTADAGFDHHLVKPPEPQRIENLLATLKSPGP